MTMQAAYLAGIVDGEGSVVLNVTGKVKRLDGARYYTLKVTIANTHLGLLEAIQRVYGGVIRETGIPKSRCKQGYALAWYGAEAENIVRIIRPHMIIKAKHCELALQYREASFSGRSLLQERTAEEHGKIADIANHIKRLNRRGVA